MNSFFWISLVSGIVILAILFKSPIIANNSLGFVSIAGALFFTVLIIKDSKKEANKIYGLILLSLILTIYYAASFQLNGSLVIAISKDFKMYFLGWEIPPTAFASLEAFFALLSSFLLTRFWLYLKDNFFEPSSLFKIIFGLILAAISFITFAWIFYDRTSPFLGLLFANLLLGLSVACIFPTHMALVSQYAPLKNQGTLMGMSFLTDAFAGYIGSLILYPSISYTNLYAMVAISVLATALIIFLLIPFLNYLFSETKYNVFIS